MSGRMGRDFQLFFGGQIFSQLGTAVTLLLLPIIVFQLTGSALNLGITAAAEMLPYLLFGLVIGAYVDRLPRRRLMIAADVARAAVIGSVPLLAALNTLPVWWIYAVGFLGTTLAIFFDTAEVAAIPSIVPATDLVEANGRVQAAYSATGVIGPAVGGALLALVSAQTILVLDTTSFVMSAVTLMLVQVSFDPAEKRERTRLRTDIAEGLRFVLRNPVLRSISAMMALINVVNSSAFAQLVFFSKHHLRASDFQVGILFAAGSLGVTVFGFLAGRIRRRFSFSQAILGALILSGLLVAALGVCPWYPLSVALWAAASGTGMFFNINTRSLRQLITPPELLGRVMSIASVLAWSAIPLGTLAGGAMVSGGVSVEALYVGIGLLTALIAALFVLSPLGRADRYVPTTREQKEASPVAAA
jgi:MFS family permease